MPGIATTKPSVCTLCASGCGLSVRLMMADADVVRNGQSGLVRIHAATKLEDLNIPGYDLHALKPPRQGRHAIKVSGPWRIHFEWKGADAEGVDLEQYH